MPLTSFTPQQGFPNFKSLTYPTTVVGTPVVTTATTPVTMTVAQLLGGLLAVDCQDAGTLTTPTAALINAAIPGAAVGVSFEVDVINYGDTTLTIGLGTGVTKFQHGDAVAVNPSWASCGRCHLCRSGEENHCLYQKRIRAPGVGYDGGHAPYVLVPDARFLVPIGDLDPVVAAPLTDAGITTYSAIKPALPSIWPGSTAVVIGIGGLGLYAVQFLRQLTGARVVAVDRAEARRTLAREYGADEVVCPGAADQVRELTRGVGAAFVIDCVGVDATLAMAVSVLAWRGRLAMVGAGGGSVPFDFFKVPPGAQLATSLNGGSIALMEVVDMAALGRLKVLVDRYPLSAAKTAYDDFQHGRLVGRAVLMPAASAGVDLVSTASPRIAAVTGA